MAANLAATDPFCLGAMPPPYKLPIPPWHLSNNFTEEALTTSNYVWLLPVGEALTLVANSAIALRILVADMPHRHAEFADVWRWQWCFFLDSISGVASSLPRAGREVSALSTTARDLLLQVLPKAVWQVLHGIVTGTRNLEDGHVAAQNVSVVSLQQLECALVLGEEALKYNRTRVSRAVFHGDVIYKGQREYTLHRTDFILAALSGSSLAKAPHLAVDWRGPIRVRLQPWHGPLPKGLHWI